MKVFVFTTHSNWPFHHETELEIIQKHLDCKDDVFRVTCTADLPICDLNPTHSILTCMECVSRRSKGERLLSGRVTSLPIRHRDLSVNELKKYLYNYSSATELQNIELENFDIGYAVTSSVISLLREPQLDIEKHRELIEDFYESSLIVYLSALKYFDEYMPERVYVFNGRLAHVKPILRAAQYRGIECLVHERGHSKEHYGLFKNTTPHDRKYVAARMHELWNKADPVTRSSLAKSFFEERVKGKEQGWYSFVRDQTKGQLPSQWDSRKRNIAVFNSSEDEFASIGPDWKNDLYDSQIDGLHKIFKDCEQYDSIHFYLRIHPNLKGLQNSEVEALRKINYKNVTVIAAESSISSYELMFHSEKVLTFGSSIGIEAVYWQKPSVQLGKSYYYELDATYKPKTHKEAVEMVFSELRPKDPFPALMYGYYFKAFGLPFVYYKPSAFNEGLFKGVDLSKSVSVLPQVLRKISQTKGVWRFIKILDNHYQSKGKGSLLIRKLFQQL